MSVTTTIKDEAIGYARRARELEAGLQKEKRGLEDRVRQLEIEIGLHKAAFDRLRTFAVHSNGVYQCPRCWIVQEISADLTPSGDDNGNDVFRCTDCGHEIVIPA